MLKTYSRRFFAYLVILIFLFLIAFAIVNATINNQERIDTTPEFIFHVLDENGYSINNIRKTEDDHPGPMYVPEYGLRANLEANNETYSLLIVQYTNYQKAIKSARLINQLDRKMDGGYAYAFDFHNILIQIYPSDKDLGLEMLKDLRKIGSIQ